MGSALLKSEAIRAVLRAPNRKVSRAVVRTNPLKNIRSMLQLNPYAAVVKKNARAKALKEAKATGKPAPANPMAKRASKVTKKAKTNPTITKIGKTDFAVNTGCHA